MIMNAIYVGSIINLFLMMASLVFLWYSFFYFPKGSFSDTQNYFDELLRPTYSPYLFLVGFSSMLLFVSLFGYMSLTENEDLMIITEMFLLLVMIAVKVYSIYFLYSQEEKRYLTVASYMYQGVVLPHKLHANSSDKTLELTYGELNERKWRCCGIFSWKDAESYRPKDCCRVGYRGVPGKGNCHELYGPNVKNCVEARSTIVKLEINRYALVIISMILTEFFGLMLYGMVLFIETQDNHRSFAVTIRDFLVSLRQKTEAHRCTQNADPLLVANQMDEKIEVELQTKLLIDRKSENNRDADHVVCTSSKKIENTGPAPDTAVVNRVDLQKAKDAANYLSPGGNGKRKLDEEGTNAANYLSTSATNGKRKPDDCKFLSTKTNGVVDAMAVGENGDSADAIPSKRNLRRLSNCKESVLQNAIALKEKSFAIRDIDSYKKCRTPKSLTRQVRLESPKTADVSMDRKIPHSESSNNESTCVSEFVDLSSVSTMSETSVMSKSDPKSQPEMNANASFSCGTYTGDLSYGNGYRPIRKKKRYFKGLSYSFGRRKNLKKRRADQLQLNQNVNLKRTNLPSTTNVSMETNGFTNLKSEDLSTISSHASSVLVETTADTQDSKPISVDGEPQCCETTPLSSAADIQGNPLRPESNPVPSGPEYKAVLCLCRVQEKVFMKNDTEIKYYCQAIDSIDGKPYGCHNPVDMLEEDVKLQRPSVKVPYQMFCKAHNHRLLLHNCCPSCGIFCTQGSFVVCDSRHMYHRKCELLVDGKRICPHCGQPSPPGDVHVSIAQERNPFFLPLQKSLKDVPSAKMTFGGSSTKSNSSSNASSILPANSLVLPSGKRITIEGLPTLMETEKLEKYLFGLLPCSSSSPAQRCTYRTLYQATRSGDIEKLMACLASGLNPNHLFRDFAMGSALHAAAAGGYLILVHVLTQAGSQLDQLDKEQNSPLILAIENGHHDIVKYLVKAGANITFKCKDGMTPLQLAAKLGNFEACYYLLSNPRCPRQYVNAVDDGGWTAVVWAAEFGHLEIVKYLLANGADPFLRDVEQNVALHWGAFSGNVEVVETLLRFNIDINCTNIHGDTPLHICARQEHYACTLLLLAQGARSDIRNAAGLLAMDCCLNKPCDTYNAIKLNAELKQMTATSREKTAKILTNDITRGHEVNPIQCVNAVDNEKEPTDFVYVTENCFTSHIKVDNTITSLKFCKCTDTCNTISCTCGKLSLSCWYTEDGILSPDFNYTDPPMLFECNSLCSCNKLTCKNRVVQHGISGRFQLFRTKGKGWGVITLRLIPKGTYVCEYIGEIISDTEADTREDDSYLFDLDNKDGETYCIDAFRYGNIARFINHSCIPNLLPVKVFINHQDLHFPRIAFFSNRDIQPNEELGFDYGEKFWIIKYKSFTCTCGAEHCRYSDATIRQTLDAYNKKLQMEDTIS